MLDSKGNFVVSKPFCRKCLLEEYDPDGALLTVREIIAALPQEQRADEAEYRRRLDICSACDQLNGGMCGMCGCYVELRAAKKKQSCPHPKVYWRGL